MIMNQSVTGLAEVHEVVSKLLDELQLGAYLFEIEPQEGQ